MRKKKRPENKNAPAIVYLVTNRLNGKRYIGVTSKRLSIRMSEHFSAAISSWSNNGHFHRAIRKYGKEVFVAKIIFKSKSKSAALRDEIRLIEKLNPEYNSTKGGDGQL